MTETGGEKDKEKEGIMKRNRESGLKRIGDRQRQKEREKKRERMRDRD